MVKLVKKNKKKTRILTLTFNSTVVKRLEIVCVAIATGVVERFASFRSVVEEVVGEVGCTRATID